MSYRVFAASALTKKKKIKASRKKRKGEKTKVVSIDA